MKWPVGKPATGAGGVVGALKATSGAITCLGTANALAAGAARTRLRNSGQAFVKPDATSYAAAEAAGD